MSGGAATRTARRRPVDPVRRWRSTLGRWRPGLVHDTLDAMAAMYGRPSWQRVHDPTSELVLTILSQNSADVNAEKAFEALCAYWPPGGRLPGGGVESDPAKVNRPGWGGVGITAAAADWAAVESAPVAELVEVIRPGGLAPQKAPRIQAALQAVREATGGYSLEFLGEMPALEARAWLTRIPGIGVKTASVVLLFCFGMPLMPVDRHVERVAKRIGLVPAKATADQAHDHFLALLQPDEMYEAHVNLITHGRRTCTAQRPAHERCAIASRCRFVNPKAP